MLTKLSKIALSLVLMLVFTSISTLVYAEQNDPPFKTTANIAIDTAEPVLEQEKNSEQHYEQAKTVKPTTASPVAALVNKPSPKVASGLSLTKMAISLAIVVLIVLALGWVFKKLTLRLPGSKHIKIISTLALGPKERLLVIEVQGKQRVLGVTANSINLLFELENSLPEEKLASDFHTQLQSFLKK